MSLVHEVPRLNRGTPWGDPERRIRVLRQRGRAVWEVHRDGERLGVVWSEGEDLWRAFKDGASKDLRRTYATRDDAIEALTRKPDRGHHG